MWSRFKRSSYVSGAGTTEKLIQDSASGIDGEGGNRPPPPDRDVEFGALPMVKTLYQGKSREWADTPPKVLSKKVAKAHDRVCLSNNPGSLYE